MRFYISTQSQLMIGLAITFLAVSALAVLFVLARLFGETVEKTRAEDPGLVCRACKSSAVRPSYPSGFLDAVFALFSIRPYRCEVCSWRFYVRRRPTSAGAPNPLH